MSDTQDTRPGRSKAGSIILTNYDATERKDIKPLVLETAIYEDIFSSSISAEFAILDASRFLDEFPIVGDEIIDVNFSSSGKDDVKLKTEMDSIEATFKTYRVDSRMAIRDRAETYVLRATTLPHVLDYTHSVEHAVGPSTIDKIVDRVYREHIQPWTVGQSKRITIDRCDGLHQFVFPKLSPMRTMAFLAEEARSLEYQNSTVHFFETHREYHFTAIESLLHRKPTESFIWIPQNIRGASTNSSEFSRHQIIIDYTEGTSFDTLIGVSQGQFGTTTQMLDPLTKQYRASLYDYDRDFHTTRRIGGTTLVGQDRAFFRTIPTSKIPSNTLVQSASHSRYLIGRASPPTPFMRQRNFTDHPRQRQNTLKMGHATMMQLQNTSTITIKVPGYSSLTAGQIINVFVPKMGEGPTTDLADQYLIVSLVHKFGLQNEYVTILECMRNAYAREVLNIPSQKVGAQPKVQAEGT